MAAALATIRQRVQRLLMRRGLESGDDATGPADRLADESPVLAGSVGASVQGRVALGPRAGAWVRRLGAARDARAATSRGAGQAHLDGFDLHANVWVPAHDRAALERLCRYVLRPPFAQERLRLHGPLHSGRGIEHGHLPDPCLYARPREKWTVHLLSGADRSCASYRDCRAD